MRDRTVQTFEIAADAAGLALILVDDEDAGGLGRSALCGDIDGAHALARSFALAQLVSHHLVFGQRAHTREQLEIVDRLGQEVVCAGAEAAQAILALVQRRHQHDRNVFGARVVLEPATGFDAVEFRHHDVHQDHVRLFGQRALDGILAVNGGDDVKVLVLQLVGEQLPVLLDVIDDQDACAHLATLRVGGGVALRGGWPAPRGPVSFFTSLMKAVIWIGLDM